MLVARNLLLAFRELRRLSEVQLNVYDTIYRCYVPVRRKPFNSRFPHLKAVLFGRMAISSPPLEIEGDLKNVLLASSSGLGSDHHTEQCVFYVFV